MINSTSDPQNPCGVCPEKQVNIVGKNEQNCLQIDLDGNKTTLFVRETSMEKLVGCEDEVRKVFDDCQATVPSIKVLSSEGAKTVPLSITEEQDIDCDKHLDQLSKRRCSGKIDGKQINSINPYGDLLGPGGTFKGKQDNLASQKKQDCIQIDLDGNNTTLFVRDTSVEELAVEIEGGNKSVDDDFTTFSSTTEGRTKTAQSLQSKTKSKDIKDNKQIHYMYDKKWSGRTYFEENIRKIKEDEYQNTIKEVESKRQLWKAFVKDMKKQSRRDIIRSSWPEWYQEPSRKQMCLAISLGDVLTADYEEEVTGRTRQWLLDLGVTTRVTPKQVRACMRRSLLNPIDFLLETHTLILKSQLNVKKKRGDLERPFSVNERILLTAVCVLHLPTLLTMLHFILPPPKPWPTEKHIQKLLFGDMEDSGIRYFTPYMEPVPFRSQTDFQIWAFDKVCRALLPSLLADETVSVSRENLDSLKLAIPGMQNSIMNQKTSTVCRNEDNNFSVFSGTDSVRWLISHYISKRDITESLFPFYDEEEGQPKFYSRKLTRKSLFKNKFRRSSLKDRRTDQEVDDSVPDEESKTGKGTVIHFNEVPQQFGRGTGFEGSLVVTGTEESYSFPDYIESSSGSKPNTELPLYSEDSSLYQKDTFHFRDEDSQVMFEGIHHPSTTIKTKDQSMEEDINKSELDEPTVSKVPSPSDLQKLWEAISVLPKKEQLKHAIKVLGEMGDPLSRLPKVHVLPSIRRWFELRQGKNRVLSKGVKEDLLNTSRGMWKKIPSGDSTQVPKVKCSKKVERLLTWDKKKWLSSEIEKERKKYYARVRQEKVDNARTFFPTMLNYYDYGSKLNRNFRDVFYTYMPAKEADTFVYKPWQPGESRK